MAEEYHNLISDMESLQVSVAPEADSYSISRMNVVKFSHIWTIEDFSFFLDKDSFSSEPFCSGVGDGVSWYLQMYPKGYGNENERFIGISLKLLTSKPDGVRATSEISIPYTNLETTKMEFNHQPLTFTPAKGWCSARFVDRDMLFMDSNFYIPGDTLTVCCKISYVEQSTECQDEIPAIRVEMSQTLGEFLKSGIFADAVLVAEGEEFHVHRAFLATCSPIFRALFPAAADHGSRIELDGVEAHELQEVLGFVYTGTPAAPESMANVLNAISGYIDARELMIKNLLIITPENLKKKLKDPVATKKSSRFIGCELNSHGRSPDSYGSDGTTEEGSAAGTTSDSEDGGITTEVKGLAIGSRS